MSIKGKVNKLRRLNIIKFIHYNYLSKHVKRDKDCYLFPYRGSVIDLREGSVLELHANYYLSEFKLKGSKQEAILHLRENANMIVNGDIRQIYGSTIEVHKDAKLTIGWSVINVGAVIISGKEINIGQEVLISRNVLIYDADHHKIVDCEGNQKNEARTTNIGDHVWIGLRATVLRGSTIGDGAMIAAGSVVGGKIKPHTMASGDPARSYAEIIWEV